MRHISVEQIKLFESYLMSEERAGATVEKYLRDVKAFMLWLADKEADKVAVIAYKAHLGERYAPASVNSIISSLNSFFTFLGWYELKIKTLKIQRRIFTSSEKELTKSEYERLLRAAKSKQNERLYLLMQTICSTGIRVSELRYITVAAVQAGRAEISCKGKRRSVFLSDKLCKVLRRYVQAQKIKSGSVFVTKNGAPLDRSNIWSDMKRLCAAAGVPKEKVFPHNLRHLFARTYYSVQKDIVRLADILGHASVNTTRIYTMESGEIHRKQLEHLGLLLC